MTKLMNVTMMVTTTTFKSGVYCFSMHLSLAVNICNITRLGDSKNSLFT